MAAHSSPTRARSAQRGRGIPVSIGERAVGADLQSVEETRIHEGIAGIELQCLRRQIDVRARAAESVESIFGLASMTWRIEREAALRACASRSSSQRTFGLSIWV